MISHCPSSIRLIFCLAMLITSLSRATDSAAAKLENWHQWRGPNADGVAPQGNPPIRWGDQQNIHWKTEIPGRGSSTPIVWQDRVFLLTAIDTGRPGEVVPPSTPQPPNPFGIKNPLRHGEKLDVLATNRLSDPIDASPAIAGKQLFLRGRKFLYCLAETSEQASEE
jgi:hypothetical protein